MTKSIKDMSREELEKYCSELERKNMLLERDNNRLESKIWEITRDRNWMRGLLENTTLPMREKITLYGSRRALEKKEPREDGLTHVYRSDISKLTGLSDSQVGDALKKLKDKGVINRKIERHYDAETDKHEQHNLIALGDLAKENPKAIDFSDDSNWGGKREKGKPNSCGCGCTDKIIDRRVTCAGCGSVLDETRKVVKADDDQDLDEEIF